MTTLGEKNRPDSVRAPGLAVGRRSGVHVYDAVSEARTVAATALGAGRRSRLRRSALTATRKLEPDIVSAAISGRRVKPKAGSNTPAAIGRAIAL